MAMLFSRGPRIAFARIITPTLTYHAYTVQDDGEGGLRVEWHGVPIPGLALTNVEAEDDVRGGWRVTGEGPEGREVWRIVRLNCGCQHSGPVPSNADELPLESPEKV